MKLPSTQTAAAIIMLLLAIAVIPVGIAMEWDKHEELTIPAWGLKWDKAAGTTIEEAAAWPAGEWAVIGAGTARPHPPSGTAAAWLRLALPRTGGNPAVLIDQVYGDGLKAYMDNRLVYDSSGDTEYSGSKVLIPLSGHGGARELYLWNAGVKEFGIEGR